VLRNRLKDPTLLKEEALIGTQWRAADDGRTLTVSNPANGERIGSVPLMGAKETREAIEAARLALPGWAAHSAKERAVLLRRWYELMMAAQDDLANILTAEQGKPLAEAKGEIAYGASFIEWFAEQVRRDQGEVVPAAQRDKRLLVLRQPVGVCAAITPWNFPNAMLTRKLGPALAAGCTMVVKPAGQTPFSALALAVLAERAGIPAGVVNVVTGRASEIAGALTASPVVRKISFTGSTDVGRRVMRDCADTVKRVSLELGGNAPFIVFDDADLDAAVEGAMIAKFRNNGQTCVCANRFFVQRGALETFAGKLSERVQSLTVGAGWEDGVQLGPLIDAAAVAKVQEHVADALAKGARLLTGGHRLAELGEHFFAPTVMTEASQSMRVAQEETFGPLAALIPFDTEAEVLAQANDTEHGLASYVYTRDLNRSWRMSEGLEYGMVGVNTGLISTAEAPFGGVKQSGLGREGSVHGMDDYTELKYVCVQIGG
jgi:succinate-semialdehyde dehydrogenase / glutarate-semialdehyde dehydrogenase